MGLDVYLERCSNKEEMQKRAAQYEKESDKLWAVKPKYEDFTEEEKQSIRDKLDTLAGKLELDEYGGYGEKVEIDSKLYPDHYFKVGYFRSSYNSGGINNIFRRHGIPGLYEIFEPGNEYEFVPLWDNCLTRAKETLKAVNEIGTAGDKDAMFIAKNPFGGYEKAPTNSREALLIYQEEEKKESEHGYSSIKGDFFPNSLNVVAAIPGKSSDRGKHEGVYIIYKSEEGLEWYAHAIEIVISTIEWVLAQPKRDEYYLVWSS